MAKEKYLFFYYWTSDRRPAAAKAVEGIGDHNAIAGAKWEIGEDAYKYATLDQLTTTYPWPFPKGNDND